MLLDLNGGMCKVVTGLVVGVIFHSLSWKGGLTFQLCFFSQVYPILMAPEYAVKSLSVSPILVWWLNLFFISLFFIGSIDERTLVYFVGNHTRRDDATRVRSDAPPIAPCPVGSFLTTTALPLLPEPFCMAFQLFCSFLLLSLPHPHIGFIVLMILFIIFVLIIIYSFVYIINCQWGE